MDNTEMENTEQVKSNKKDKSKKKEKSEKKAFPDLRLNFTKANTQFTAMSFIIPIAIIALSFFTFSYLASRKIKKVEIKELVVE